MYINPNKSTFNGDETNSINEIYELSILIRMNEFDVGKLNCYKPWEVSGEKNMKNMKKWTYHDHSIKSRCTQNSDWSTLSHWECINT